MLVASADGAVRTYDAASGELVATLQHARRVRDAAFSADGRLVATTVEDSRIRIWDARTAERVRTLDQGGFALSVAFDPTGTFFASTGANRTLRVWDARTWASVFEKVEPSGRVVPVAFGPGGRLVADGQTGGVGAIRDASDGSLVGRMKHDNAHHRRRVRPHGDQDRDREHGPHRAGLGSQGRHVARRSCRGMTTRSRRCDSRATAAAS